MRFGYRFNTDAQANQPTQSRPQHFVSRWPTLTRGQWTHGTCQMTRYLSNICCHFVDKLYKL